jgi:hypothetical protein
MAMSAEVQIAFVTLEEARIVRFPVLNCHKL